MNVTVLEVELSPGADIDVVRKWLANSIRSGDGLMSEKGRLFVVVPGLHEDNAGSVIDRLYEEANRLGAKLILRRISEDGVADSLARRAEAKIIPVEPRRTTQ